ncbi:MAG: hypothetical protein BAJALOKI3v1_10100 [Promethearchaeota archaeon]|jgi:predicted nuclease of restriction endonuclease-like RecB superfamily|nr:MAG: hypothetical protein BAJALOKI3v1_10100 [Candidatus Lokiarchaeota archaeon]
MSGIASFFLGGILFVSLVAVIYYIIQLYWRKIREKYTPQRATSFRCLDGHITRSKAELIIDNHLTRLNIKHEYEDMIRIAGHTIKYDWYLPDHDIYIEYWGYFGKDYFSRKREKLKLYQKGGLNLISIEDWMLEDIYTHLEEKLTKIISLETLTLITKFCPNCGENLDDRFI